MKPIYVCIVFGVMVLGIGGLVAWKYLDTESLIAATDSSKVDHTVNIGTDSWAGYSILCSAETRRLALLDKVLLKCHDDKANYSDRVNKLASGTLQMGAVEVSGYILAGAALTKGYPAGIQFVIDESRGGDAIVARKSVALNTDDVKKRKKIRIGYTKDSPSHTLMTKWALDFDVKLGDPNAVILVETKGSKDAAKRLMNNEIDVAVLWQPDVAKVLANANFVKLLGTENTKNLIVDVLVANNRFANNKPEVINSVTKAYFLALEYYKKNPRELDNQIVKYTGIDIKHVSAVKDGINWIDLPHNSSDWLGLGGGRVSRQLYDTIASTVKLFKDVGTPHFNTSPLPNDDPFRIISSGSFETVYGLAMAGKLGGVVFSPITKIADVSVTRKFKSLSPGRWTKWKAVGSLKVQPIRFKSGTSDLDEHTLNSFKKLVEMLTTYPNYRIKVVGHTGRRGDQQANATLSKNRATAAAKYLIEEFGIDKNRIQAYGVDNQQPPNRIVAEKKRAYYARWPRVELVLVGR
jgi:ABC-type taurine transport system substrate-binding protein